MDVPCASLSFAGIVIPWVKEIIYLGVRARQKSNPLEKILYL